MIPSQNIVAWANVVPWVEPRQVEQDLIISRSLVEMFSDPSLRDALRFRGGTALNKLHLPTPLRYSEDIDLVRTSKGPIGPIIDRLRATLEPWLGAAKFTQSPVAPKLRFRADPEDGSDVPIRLKIEINTREVQAFDGPVARRLEVVNPWFTGQADLPTFSPEEMLATKLRALLQRNKGRDLYDLAEALPPSNRSTSIAWSRYSAPTWDHPASPSPAPRRRSACSRNWLTRGSGSTSARCCQPTGPRRRRQQRRPSPSGGSSPTSSTDSPASLGHAPRR